MDGERLLKGRRKHTLIFFDLKLEGDLIELGSKRLRIPFFLSVSSIFWLNGVFLSCI